MVPSNEAFREKQRLPRRRTFIMLAIPPCGMLGILVWQVVLGHPWGNQHMSNASLIGWTIFLWIIYFRLITVSMITEVRNGELTVILRGLWRTRRVPASDISEVETITYDPERDFGGYGIRSTRNGTAYISSGKQGVRIHLANGSLLVVGSQRPSELAGVLRRSIRA